MKQGVGSSAPIAAQMPDASEWPPIAVVRETLANGLRVIMAENRTVPLVFLSWTSQAGFESDPAGLEGIGSLTPLLLREGTGRQTAEQIAETIDDLGADLVAGANWNAAFLNLELLSCDVAAGADLLIDMACHAQFPEAAVNRFRQRRLAELEGRRREPRAIANDAFARAVFGSAPYGRSPLGTSASVQRIDAAQVAAFHDAHYHPATSYVVVAGNFDTDVVTGRLGSFELPAAFLPGPPLPLPFALGLEPPGGVRLVDIPRATQTEIRVGHAAVARDSHELPALEVLNAILGGGPASRLARSVREGEGLTYHVRSRLAARRLGGTLVVETSVANEATGAALAAIRRELERLSEERVPAADVEQAKRCLLGADLRRFQDLFGTGATLGPAALYGDPAYDFERRKHAIAAVEPEALRELARRYLHPERLVAVVAGPIAALQSQLSSDAAHGCPLIPLEQTS